MFCCLSGSNKEERAKDTKELATKMTNKKPEDFMKDPIPLFLNQHIIFNMDKNHKWNLDINVPERVDRKQSDNTLLKNKLKENESRLKEMNAKQRQIEKELQLREKQESQCNIELAKSQLSSKAIEYMIANQTKEIYQYEQKVRMNE